MGNSDSNCYEFRKEDKNKLKAKYAKGKNDQALESDVDLPHIDNNSLHGNKKKECDSTNSDAYTPVRCSQSNYQSSQNSVFFDPRSPSEGIYRTPLQIIEKTVPALDDPRSPTQGIDRTPIVKMEDVVSEESFDTVSCNLVDPRSPTLEIDRTPLGFPGSTNNLRRTAMLANALSSSLSHKHLGQDNDEKAIVDDLKESLDFDQSFNENIKQSSGLKLTVKTDTTSATLSDDDYTTSINNEVTTDVVQHVNVSKTNDKEQNIDGQNNTNSKDESICSLSEIKNCVDTQKSENSMSQQPLQNTSKTHTPIEIPKKNETQSSSSDICQPRTTPTGICTMKSNIPTQKLAERKRSALSIANKPTVVKNENLVERAGKLKKKPLNIITKQSPRSPLAVLSHNNSPEPKRIKANNEPLKRTSRLPRYRGGQS